MSLRRKRWAAALFSGVLFAVGLALSGMTRPSKVVGFLDFFGDWDASLALVMLGASVVHFISLKLILRRERPLFDAHFRLPTRRDIDWRLLVGAGVFGVGWGLSGFCPGPALTSALTGGVEVWLFLLGMFGGVRLFRLVDRAQPGGRDVEQPNLVHSPERVETS